MTEFWKRLSNYKTDMIKVLSLRMRPLLIHQLQEKTQETKSMKPKYGERINLDQRRIRKLILLSRSNWMILKLKKNSLTISLACSTILVAKKSQTMLAHLFQQQRKIQEQSQKMSSQEEEEVLHLSQRTSMVKK